MELALMIEGQEGVSWQQWLALAQACEEHGIPTLFRSDHYMNLDGLHPERGSLDALGTCIALGAVTKTLRLGTMVSPASFRHPSVLAKLATTADHVSGGRFELGLGGGWHEREHAAYGFPYHDLRTRVEVLAEQLEIVHGHWRPGSFSFTGKHYRIDELDAQPKPVRGSRPPLIMGGSAAPKVAALAARYADEYNTPFASLEVTRERRDAITAACEAAGREPLRFSLMIPVIIGTDETQVRERAARSAEFRGMDPEALYKQPPEGWLVGTVEAVAEQIKTLEQAGVSRIMCQHLPHDDLEMVELLGRALGPMVA